MKNAVLLAVCLPLLHAQGVGAQTETGEEETWEKLAKQLESKDVQVRRDAVRELSILGAAGLAMPALTKALKDPDREVRAMAARCFASFRAPFLGDPDVAVSILAEMLLKDPDLNVRKGCAVSLDYLTRADKDVTRDVAPALLSALSDKDPDIRVHVAGALALLGKGGKKPFRLLVEGMDDEDEDRRWRAIEGLGEVGLPALPTLQASVQHKSARVRMAATHAFRTMFEELQRKGQKPPPEVVPPLAAALDDTDEKVLTGAMWALRTISPLAQDTIPKIMHFLEHSDSDVRHSAVIALGEFGAAAKAAIPALQEVFSDGNWYVRRDAPKALAKIAGKAAIPALQKVLSDSNYQVRRGVVEALGTIRDDPPSVVPVLIEALADKDTTVQQEAIRQLASFGPAAEAAVPRLIELLHDRDGFVRVEAANALPSFGAAAEKAIPALIKLLQHGSLSAAKALGELHRDPTRVVPALIAALDDEEPGVRMWAATSLGCFGREARSAVPRLTKLTKDEDRNVRDSADSALELIEAHPSNGSP